MALDLSRFAKAFFEEAQEHVQALESMLIAIDVDQPDDDSLNAIFRAVHSIKGGAAAFGHTTLAAFTHDFESLLDKIRKRMLALTKQKVDQFLRASDLMRQHISALEAGHTPDPVPMENLRGSLQAMATQPSTIGAATASDKLAAVLVAPHHFVALTLDRGAYPDDASITALADDMRGLGRVDNLMSEVIDADRIEVSFRLFDIDGDETELRESLEFLVPAESLRITFTDPSAVAESSGAGELDDDPDGAYEFFAPLDEPPPAEPAAAPVLSEGDIALSSVADASSIRVNVSKVDQIINQVGELVIAEAMLTQATSQLAPELQQQLAAGLAALQRNTRDLQESVLAIRMMPISFVFSRLPRLTRDLADRLGKDVHLEMHGEETELDKSVIEKLSDPLTHLVRNAIDHGIESVEEREAHGKPRIGVLDVRASHAGGSVIISVSDDGRGLNREGVLAKAMEFGLGDMRHWSDEEVWQLIFTPGFSTAKAVTDVSGRGVGMDVVWQNVHALGGKTDIRSWAGRGTTITIRLPLTLAILDGLSVAVAGETYILALSNVMQSMQPRADEIKTLNGERVVMVRDEYVPILSLADVFDLQRPEPTGTTAPPILVVLDVDGLHAAVEVDELVGQQQVVLKSLESNYRRVPGIAGATILGDGRVALILDAAYLVSLGHALARNTGTGSRVAALHGQRLPHTPTERA
jgi:two-component system chemotaxis sensor kinase CheA